MKNTILLLAGILIFCTSCKYLNKTCSYSDLEIERNTIGLKKISLSESGINSYNSWLNQYARWQLGCGKDEEYNVQGQWRDANGKQAEIMYGNSDVRIYQNVKFADKDYYLFLCGNDIIIVNKENKKQVKNFSTGKLTYGFLARQIILQGKPYLVIITYYPTWRTNTSVLIILDSDFSIVYKEILTSVKYSRGGDIGCINSDKYGNCIIIKSNNEWRRYEWDEWQKINGDWVYYLPEKQKIDLTGDCSKR